MGPGVILVRHGETALNKKAVAGDSGERIRGWLDVPLDKQGRIQALETARRVASTFSIRRVYASPLQRAYETGRQIGIQCKAPALKDPALKPWNVGDWSGKPVQNVLPLMERYAKEPNKPAPGGEPFARFARRFLEALIEMLDEARATSSLICAVAHTRNLQLTQGWLAAGAKPDLSYDVNRVNDYREEVPTGGWLEVRAT